MTKFRSEDNDFYLKMSPKYCFLMFEIFFYLAVIERKSGIRMLLRNSYTAYIQRSKLYWIAALSD